MGSDENEKGMITCLKNLKICNFTLHIVSIIPGNFTLLIPK